MSTLMTSISGIRGIVGDGLDPETIVKYVNAYADFIEKGKVVIGRDSRISGEMFKEITAGVLMAKGINVIDIGICPTPTVQFNVKELNADGGIAISASHNPNEWNALKLLNGEGQVLSPKEYKSMINNLEESQATFKSWNEIGKRTEFSEGLKNHIDAILTLSFLDLESIRKKKFKVVVDCVNGAGAYCVPDFLRNFGCEVVETNCEKNGMLVPHPEPLPENIKKALKKVIEVKADLGIVVDPDVDRLVLITEKAEPFIEENTITQVVKFILSKQAGNVVVNLSTTRAVDDVADKFGAEVFRSAVGEANVVKKMKEVDAVIGGEGSGGVIYPDLHFGRDALCAIAITLQHLTEFGESISKLKESLPEYFIVKKKIEVKSEPEKIINTVIKEFKNAKINTEDGVRVDFEDHWVHFRKSNTEPIIRIIVEANTKEKAIVLSDKYLQIVSRRQVD
ncbi:MAG: phosphoglucosamine mutase [Ignavibacteria bacterium]|nr:phosphoglucosamine mutase [Ignavibacteria bacterium]MBT8383239.1 phosphoglucosamine mutase [Ignavibacteria bacterium]MBT8391731.1 phosphoglucosamine mutase [Ignavibacteria bacterium]NNJ51595.1 phosphoglucosamine mutase [Ignavibacteriaceae bacterium]NNL21314.1 phosphoglucosamine mutase [Ignavibacteriaceae bacterium]